MMEAVDRDFRPNASESSYAQALIATASFDQLHADFRSLLPPAFARRQKPALPATEMNVEILRLRGTTRFAKSFCYAQDDNLELMPSQRTRLRSFGTLL